MSDANRVGLYIQEESTFGTAASGNYQTMRFTGESLAQQQGTTTSAEIRSDRQVTDLVRTSLSAAGAINFELSPQTFTDLFEALLQGTVTTGTDDDSGFAGDFAASDNSINADSGTPFSNYAVGDWIYVGGGTLTNPGFYKVESKPSSTKIIVSGQTVVDEDPLTNITVKHLDQVVNGTTFRSFTIEKHFADLTNNYALYTGMVVSGMSLNVTPDGIVTGSFEFLGKNETSQTSSTAGTPVAATTTDVLNAIDNVTVVLENGSSFEITGMTMNVSNNLRERLVVGELGAQSIGSGQFDVNGTLNFLYEDSALAAFNRAINLNDTSLTLIFDDGTNGIIIFDMPRVKLSAPTRQASGINTDVVANVNFQAIRDSTEGNTLRIAVDSGYVVGEYS